MEEIDYIEDISHKNIILTPFGGHIAFHTKNDVVYRIFSPSRKKNVLRNALEEINRQNLLRKNVSDS